MFACRHYAYPHHVVLTRWFVCALLALVCQVLRSVQDCPTRWNGTFHMCQRNNELAPALRATMNGLTNDADTDTDSEGMPELSEDDCPPLAEPEYSSGDDTEGEDEEPPEDTSTMLPTPQEWSITRQLEASLEPAYEATNFLEGDKYCTLDRAWPILAGLHKRYKEDTHLQVRLRYMFDFPTGEYTLHGIACLTVHSM
jgi:hypothetical protein